MPPGGHVDMGEDVLSSVIRETKEETGIKLAKKEVTLRAVAIHHHLDRKESFLIFVFVAKLSKPQKAGQVSHEGSAEWAKISELKKSKDLFPVVKDYLPHILKNSGQILFTSVDCQNSQINKIHSWIES